jgi:hypothetical protein
MIFATGGSRGIGLAIALRATVPTTQSRQGRRAPETKGNSREDMMTEVTSPKIM